MAISETNTPYRTHLTSALGQVRGSGIPTRGGSPSKSETNGNNSPVNPRGSGIHSIQSGPSNDAIFSDGTIQAQSTTGD